MSRKPDFRTDRANAPIVEERLSSLTREKSFQGGRRYGALRLGMIGSGILMGAYIILYVPFKDAHGRDYEHVFSPVRRAWQKHCIEGILGLPPKQAQAPEKQLR